MTLRLYIEPEAEAELEEAADHYEESVPGLALEFLVEMRLRTNESSTRRAAFQRTEASRAFDARMPLAVPASHRVHAIEH